MPDRARRSVPIPRPATVGELVTLTVVEAPAASVTEVPPLAAKKMDETCGTLDSERIAVRADRGERQCGRARAARVGADRGKRGCARAPRGAVGRPGAIKSFFPLAM